MKMKHGILFLIMLVVGMAINQGLSTSKSLGETLFFFAYGGTWAFLLSAVWVFWDEGDEKNWRRAHGIE